MRHHRKFFQNFPSGKWGNTSCIQQGVQMCISPHQRFCYLFIYLVFNPEVASVHFWPALSLSSNYLFTKWKYIQHQWCIYSSRKYQQLQWFICPSMHSALEINNSEKKGMGLKLRKEPPVLWWQVPKQAEAASQLRSNASFQTCSRSLLVELFRHLSGMQHFYEEVIKRKQPKFCC